jgi:chaperonin cofactor prefoldin
VFPLACPPKSRRLSELPDPDAAAIKELRLKVATLKEKKERLLKSFQQLDAEIQRKLE